MTTVVSIFDPGTAGENDRERKWKPTRKLSNAGVDGPIGTQHVFQDVFFCFMTSDSVANVSYDRAMVK